MISDTNVTSDAYLQFLQDKINDLRSALFFSMSDAVLKLPTSIVTALKVDEIGQVWFFVNKPKQSISEFDKEFPTRLDFFKKGKDYHLNIMGKACIVNDPEEINGLVSVTDDVKTKAMNQLVLIKVKIQNVEYYENKPQANYNLFKSMGARLHKLLFNPQPGYRPYGTAQLSE